MPHTLFSTKFGTCGIAWGERGLTGFALPDTDDARLEQRLASRSRPPDRAEPPAWVQAIIGRVQRHLAGEPQDFADLRYDYTVVSDFQRRVYEAALAVKSGQTQTYGYLATALELPPGGARSIGTALGENPWPLLVPCHRFIAASGKMTGFSAPGGIQTKTRLLALEGSQLISE
jgi:methylated-DNA-[protein]-cysteine S-methyltransferase